VLIRRARSGPEVLMGRRPPRSAFAPDVFVFPGGRLDAADVLDPAPLDDHCARLAARSRRRAGALARTALRETAEETGLVVAPERAALRLIARAITPTDSPIRFHARFFHADAEAADGELGGDGELADLAFRPLSDALALPIMDVTEAVLTAVRDSGGAPPSPFLFCYRGGRPAPRPLRVRSAAPAPRGGRAP
jgi:8-oxo-dGTP pyrophosphatase MutT (NUDIX family)